MNPFQKLFDRLKAVDSQRRSAQSALELYLRSAGLVGDAKKAIEESLSNLERTYILLLFAEFEGGLEEIGPALGNPVTFTDRDGLGYKLDQIGSKCSMDQGLRDECNQDIRALRNELLHGRSRIPRLPIERIYSLMLAFARGCH